LLVAARETGALPNLDASVGTGFGDNGDQFSIYAYTGEPVGPTTQSAPIASAAWITQGVPLPMCVEGGPFPVGGTLPILMTICMTSDTDHRGRWVYNPLTRKVKLADWHPNTVASKQGCDDYTNHVLATNPNCVPSEVTWPFGMTVHPLGGCNLGVSTDQHGRLKGYKNLYAVDGSLMPGNSAAANPSLTIAALAERCIADIIAKAG
jgi:cholesterol oxidase